MSGGGIFAAVPRERLQILIVGIDGIGKQELAAEVVDASKAIGVELDALVANSLPLHQQDEEHAIDLIVFMVDMRSKLSLERAAESEAAVNKCFCLARSFLVLFNAETPAGFSFAVEEATAFANTRGMQVRFCTLEDARSLKATGAALVSAARRTKRLHHLSPMFMSALDVDFVSKSA